MLHDLFFQGNPVPEEEFFSDDGSGTRKLSTVQQKLRNLIPC